MLEQFYLTLEDDPSLPLAGCVTSAQFNECEVTGCDHSGGKSGPLCLSYQTSKENRE